MALSLEGAVQSFITPTAPSPPTLPPVCPEVPQVCPGVLVSVSDSGGVDSFWASTTLFAKFALGLLPFQS